MRITCSTYDEFLEVLSGSALGAPVFVSLMYRSLTEEPPRTASSVEVIVALSTVVAVGEGEALLEAQFSTGIWRKTADGDDVAEQDAIRIKESIRVFCEQNGLTLLPGVLDA